MKTAFFSIEFPPRIFGGLGVYVNEMAKELVSMGENISVFTWGERGLERHEKLSGIEVFREVPVSLQDGLEGFLSAQTLAWGEGLRFLADLLSYNQLAAADLLETGPWDLCVAQDWLGLPAAMATRRAGVPMIFHVHGLETGRSDSPNLQLIALEKKGAMMADGIITVSEAMKQELCVLGIPDKKIRVCYHGVDAQFFDPKRADPKRLQALRERYGLEIGDLVLLFIGRLEPVKGITQLLLALPSIVARNPKAKLLVIGKGSLEEHIREEMKLLRCVTLVTDFLDDGEKMHHYALADVCVFPSLYEPFGIVALEAAAMGKPAVVGASGTSGLREIVENPAALRPTGIHVNARDPLDIAWGINLALQDRERMQSWGENARQRVLEKFTWQKAAERTLEIYREVVDAGA
jgi:glycosyltransferase involved in cell wall biosynthesis